MENSVQMKLNIQKETNILLRRFVLEDSIKNKEVAINYILKNFLSELYKIKEVANKKWQRNLIQKKVINALIVENGLGWKCLL